MNEKSTIKYRYYYKKELYYVIMPIELCDRIIQ